MTDKKLAVIFGAVAACLLALVVVVALVAGYFFLKRQNPVETAATPSQTPVSQINAQATTTPTSGGSSGGEIPFFSDAFGLGQTKPGAAVEETSIPQIIVRLLLALIFSSLLAFRPKRNIPLFQRNISVAQTQILLAVVAAALMMIVGDNAARAFAIFAAVSFVRFRTNIRDPKEITVLLISLALGLAAGVGRWDLGIVLCLFALILLWILEYREPEQVHRAMELTVKTQDLEKTQDLLKNLFARHKLETEIRQINPPDEKNSVGCIVYYLNMPLTLSTDALSEQIVVADSGHIEGIVWQNQKNSTYVYQ